MMADSPESLAVNTGPLKHIKVLDLSRVLAGPWASQMLGDMGAEVVKVERPADEHSRGGDDTRHWGPPFITNADGLPGDAGYFLCANRNKTSISVDIATPEGQERIRQLILESDVLLENYKVGGLKKYGLDYDSVKALNPRLVYCSITGFGQTGPYANRPGYDFLIQAMGGIMSLTGSEESGPLRIGVAMVDLMTGMYATTGILAALNHRDQTGEGQHIDVALLDCQVASLANQAMNYLVSGEAPGRIGNSHPNIVPYEAFETADGYLILAVGNDSQFGRFARLANREDWVTDSRFCTNDVRVRNRKILVPEIAQVMKSKTTKSWITELEKHSVPCGPVNTLKEVFADPQVQHREMLRYLEREDGTVVPTVASPLKFSKTPVSYRKAPPKFEG